MNESGRIDNFDHEPGGCGTQALVYGIIIAVIFLLSGCKSIQYVPVPEYHHDSIYFTNVQFDSIYIKDSTYQHEFTRNDTVFSETVKWKTKYKEKAVHDTSYIERVDSVSVPVPVERKLTARERIYMKIGEYSIYGIFAIVILYAIRLRFKRF